MELVKRYIYAVTQKLPEGQRVEIEKELRGLIEDMLEERLLDGQPTDQDVEAVLMELGDPEELADRYRGKPRYLVGPEMFGTYWTILKAVLFAVGIAMLVVFIIDSLSNPFDIHKHLVKAMASFLTGSTQAFAWVTFIFGLAEYYGIQKDKLRARQGTPWKPSDLPPLPDTRIGIHRAEPIVSIVFIILFTALVSYSSDLAGIWFSNNEGPSTVVPFFDQEVFRGFLPFVWVTAALSIVNETLKVIAGKWTIKQIALEVVTYIVQFLLILFMFSDSSVWNPQFLQQLLDFSWTAAHPEEYQTIVVIWERATSSIITFAGVILVIQFIYLGVKVLKMKGHIR
jgi:hypothetical protein